MKMKITAFLAFLLNTLLFGSYYAVSKEALGRIDPIVFTFVVMTIFVPLALCLLIISWQDITREIVKSGALLGSCLGLGLFMLSIALKYNSATSTAFFPSLNGFLAAFCAWLFLRQPIGKATWLAGLVSVAGAMLLILNSPMGGVRGSLIAFIGGLFCTFYVFLADYEQRGKEAPWALLGTQLLTMALWANLIALLFGDWQAVHPSLPKDIWVVLYISSATCLPIVFTVLLQRYISPVTVSFIYILEPVMGTLVAYLYLREQLPLQGYIGGGLIVAGAFIHTWGTAAHPASSEIALHRRLSLAVRRFNSSWIGLLGYPLLWFCLGAFVVYKIGGFPPADWNTLFHLAPTLPPLMAQGHSIRVVLLAAQAACWLLAWCALVGLGALTLHRLRLAISQLEQPAMEAALQQPMAEQAPHPAVWDVRTLRQLGITPTSSTITRRRGDKPLVQRRRHARNTRLAQAEMVE